MNAGDSIVLGVDDNYDVRTSDLSQKLTELGLRGAILTLHAPASPPTPNYGTYGTTHTNYYSSQTIPR